MTPPDDVSTRLAEIRERVEAATEGPWGVYRCTFADEAPEAACGVTSPPLDSYEGDVFQDASRDECHHVIARDDAAFIASSRSDVPYLLSLVEEVVDLAAGWRRAYPPEVFPEPPERPADGAKLVWIDPETGEQLSEPFAIDRASAAMGRFMAERLFTALRDAAQEGAE